VAGRVQSGPNVDVNHIFTYTELQATIEPAEQPTFNDDAA